MRQCHQGTKRLLNDLKALGKEMSKLIKKMMRSGLDLKVEEFLRRQRDLISEMMSTLESCRCKGHL